MNAERFNRRERARDAAWAAGDDRQASVEAAINSATQVKITDDIVNAARRASTIGFETPSGIKAAFRVAGFEVVE